MRPARTRARSRLPRSGLHRNNPVWSPDDQWIYFVSGIEPQNEMNVDVWRARPTGGEPERLTTQHAAVNYPALIDARTLLYVAREEDGSGPWLWALDVERKTTTRVSTGVDQYTSVAASRDGRRLVATVANPSSSLWRVPLTDRHRGRSRGAAVSVARADRTGVRPSLRRRIAVLSVRTRHRRRVVESRRERARVAGVEKRGRSVVRTPSRIPGRSSSRAGGETRREAHVVDHVARRIQPADVGGVHRDTRRRGSRGRGLVA